MRTLSATEASRGFSDILDEVERGETIRIMRRGGVVAELRPAAPHSFQGLKDALRQTSSLGDSFASDVAHGLAMISEPEIPSWDVG